MKQAIGAVLLTIVSLSAADKKVSDDRLYDIVREKLANDPDVKGGGLDVEVKDGVVVLKGKVGQEKARSKAERIVRKVKGVTRVDNQLTVSPLRM